MNLDVRELRRSERFVVRESLRGSFAGVEVRLLNLCEHGAMIEHAQPLRLGTRSRLLFSRGPFGAAAYASVIWSHLVKQGTAGPLVYQSGLQVDPEEAYRGTFFELVQQRAVAPDGGSLDRKRQKLEERERRKTDPGNTRVVPVVQPDPTLLVRTSWAKLKEDPEEIFLLYLRAREAAADAVIEGEPEDVIAVWEHLGRSVDIHLVDRALRRAR